MMRIAVTGGMGFIGTEVVSLLEERGHEVTVVDFWGNLIRSYEKNRFPILERVYQNLARASDVLEPCDLFDHAAKSRFNSIIHLGAIVDTTDLGSQEMIERNVDYTRQLVKTVNSQHFTPSDIIFASSAATYGLNKGVPNNPYGLTKVLGENVVARSAGFSVSLRFFNVFGEFEHHKGVMASVPFKIAQAYRTGDRFELHSPDSARDFISVSCVAETVARVAYSQLVSGVCDVGTGVATTFDELDGLIMRATGNITSACRIVPMPEHISGRYQTYTKAGMTIDRVSSGQSTIEGIEEQYGKH